MPYVDNNGIRIHYQVDGNRDEPPLVLMHGTFQSLEDWYESGWVEGLKNDNQLVLVDHRGMGHSDKPHDPDVYTLELRVADIVAVLDALDIVKARFLTADPQAAATIRRVKPQGEATDGQEPCGRRSASWRRVSFSYSALRLGRCFTSTARTSSMRRRGP